MDKHSKTPHLTGRTAAKQLHLSLLRQALSVEPLFSIHGLFQQQIAIFGEDGAVGIVSLKRSRGAFDFLDGPTTDGDAGLMKTLGQTAASREDVEALERSRRRS